jgi:hypothetical protein
MKKVLYFLFTILFVCYSCNKQENNKVKKETKFPKQVIEKPNVKVKVNKKYDKDGNLIAFDSTYTSYYAGKISDSVVLDSLFKKFKPSFNKQFPIMNDQYFDQLFYTDSLYYSDFFHEDFFRKRMELNQEYINKMMQKMDSIKNAYFKVEGNKSKNTKINNLKKSLK